jgi:tetratricopeptide (TPR) repeat protein
VRDEATKSNPAASTRRFSLPLHPIRRRLGLLAVVLVLGLIAVGYGSLLGQGGPSATWADRPLPELEALARRDPQHAGAQFGLGLRYARAGELKRAVAALERCVALAPRSLEAHTALGEIARRQNDHRRAAEMFAAAVRLDPSFDEGYLHAANAFVQMQSYRKARPLAGNYAQRRPVDWRGPFLLGMIASGEGNMDESLAHYSEVVRRAPHHAPAYLNAGATYLYGPSTTERLTAAARWFERGLEVAPRYPELHYYLGLVRCRQRRWPDAVPPLRQAVELNPSLTEAYYPLSQSLRRLGRAEEARLCLDLYQRQRREARQ